MVNLFRVKRHPDTLLLVVLQSPEVGPVIANHPAMGLLAFVELSNEVLPVAPPVHPVAMKQVLPEPPIVVVALREYLQSNPLPPSVFQIPVVDVARNINPRLVESVF